jgi:uncharacterized protein YebE (UPF0316 family)
MADVFSSALFVYGVVPLLIMFSRIVDVSLGTVRIILSNRGVKGYSAIIGFFEVLIWLIVITTILNNLNNVVSYIAYAAGFATGTYLGILIEERIAIGQVRLRIITKKDLAQMLDDLKPTRYVFVSNSANSSEGRIRIINAFLERKDLKAVIKKVKERDPNAFYTVEDLKMIHETMNAQQPIRLRKAK